MDEALRLLKIVMVALVCPFALPFLDEEAIETWNRRTQPENKPLDCKGCIDHSEDEGWPDVCLGHKPERSEG